MAISYDSVHLRLVEAVPEFGPVLEEHLEDQDGEVLAHVLFGDFTRFVLAAHQEDDHELVSRSLAFLEEAIMDGDQRTRNLVAVSFVENIGPRDEGAADFIAGWPPALKEEGHRQREPDHGGF